MLQTLGVQINIAALIDEINGNSDLFLFQEHETDVLLSINRTDGINKEALKNINETRLSQPVLVAKINGNLWLIDGNHRLLKRQELGKKLTSCIIINGSQLAPHVLKLNFFRR